MYRLILSIVLSFIGTVNGSVSMTHFVYDHITFLHADGKDWLLLLNIHNETSPRHHHRHPVSLCYLRLGIVSLLFAHIMVETSSIMEINTIGKQGKGGDERERMIPGK